MKSEKPTPSAASSVVANVAAGAPQVKIINVFHSIVNKKQWIEKVLAGAANAQAGTHASNSGSSKRLLSLLTQVILNV